MMIITIGEILRPIAFIRVAPLGKSSALPAFDKAGSSLFLTRLYQYPIQNGIVA
jgi:hypothetical protein